MTPNFFVDHKLAVMNLVREHFKILEKIQEPASLRSIAIVGESGGKEIHYSANIVDTVNVDVDEA